MKPDQITKVPTYIEQIVRGVEGTLTHLHLAGAHLGEALASLGLIFGFRQVAF
jgi:hypothetical protein